MTAGRFVSQKDGTVKAAAALAAVPLFADLSREVIDELAGLCAPRHLADGGYLFRAHETADRLYVLCDGTLEIVGAGERVLNTIAPAALVGELAVLRGATRSASVRARGGAVVLTIHAGEFLDMARRRPDLALAVAREVANGFVGIERRALERHTPLWAVVLDADMDPDVALALTRAALRAVGALSTSRKVLVFAPISAASFEEQGMRIKVETLLMADAREVSAMVLAARRDAALVVVAAAPAALAGVLPDCTGIVSSGLEAIPGSAAPGARHIAFVDGGAPSATRVLGPPRVPLAAAAGRAVRLLLRVSVGVALGGGAARALAGLGVLDVMEQLGVPVDFVAGSSTGAAVGGFALGAGVGRTIAMLAELRSPRAVAHRFIDRGLRATGRIEGRRLIEAFKRALPVREIGELHIPYGAVTLDADTGEERILRAGRLAEAMRASGVLPGLLDACSLTLPGAEGPSRLLDGGLAELVPVDAVRALGADRVVSVHTVKLADFRLLDGDGANDAAERLSRIEKAQLMALARVGERQGYTADIAILPDAGSIGLGDFWRSAVLIEAGRQAALAAADRLRALDSV